MKIVKLRNAGLRRRFMVNVQLRRETGLSIIHLNHPDLDRRCGLYQAADNETMGVSKPDIRQPKNNTTN
jgi:hypothetical protein